jgi:hypothetical protein
MSALFLVNCGESKPELAYLEKPHRCCRGNSDAPLGFQVTRKIEFIQQKWLAPLRAIRVK